MKTEDRRDADPRTAAGSGPAHPLPGDAVPGVEELIRQHRELDERLRAFTASRNLTPSEQYEAAVMKKRKLALKDRITALAGPS